MIEELIDSVKSGNQSAFEALYNLYSEKIYYVAYRFGLSEEDSAEVVQDVFVKVWERRRYLRTDLSFNAYLLTISKNFIIKKAKKNTTQTAFQKYYSKMKSSADNSTEDMIAYADLFKVTNSFINSLPTQQRQIFVLSKFDRLSHQEISKKLNLSVRTIENHIYRATGRLRKHLKDLGVILSIIFSLFIS